MGTTSAAIDQRRGQATRPGGVPRLRADARRNRDQLLHAARDVFVEHGPSAALEEVARRAGVGIATLYRRFPDRQSLQRAVALDVLARVAQEADHALAEEPDAFLALARYMHRALGLRVGAVMPVLMSELSLADEALLHARDEAAVPVQAMIAAAQAAGTLRPDVDFGDIGLLIARLCQPLPGPFSRAMADELAHRHLAVLLDGLRGTPDRSAAVLPGPALTLGDLQALAPDEDSPHPPAPSPIPRERGVSRA
ncbi:MAG: TetR/AcrR family transcriptional regulator [Thermomicrobiales bacterium]